MSWDEKPYDEPDSDCVERHGGGSPRGSQEVQSLTPPGGHI